LHQIYFCAHQQSWPEGLKTLRPIVTKILKSQTAQNLLLPVFWRSNLLLTTLILKNKQAALFDELVLVTEFLIEVMKSKNDHIAVGYRYDYMGWLASRVFAEPPLTFAKQAAYWFALTADQALAEGDLRKAAKYIRRAAWE